MSKLLSSTFIVCSGAHTLICGRCSAWLHQSLHCNCFHVFAWIVSAHNLAIGNNQLSSCIWGNFVCGTLLIHSLVWEILFIMFLSVRHCNFIFLVYGTRAVSIGQFFWVFLSTGYCAVSHKQIHKITVSYKEKHDEQCFQTKSQMRSVPQTNVPFIWCLIMSPW
jgi:hypothetical protein